MAGITDDASAGPVGRQPEPSNSNLLSQSEITNPAIETNEISFSSKSLNSARW